MYSVITISLPRVRNLVNPISCLVIPNTPYRTENSIHYRLSLHGVHKSGLHGRQIQIGRDEIHSFIKVYYSVLDMRSVTFELNIHKHRLLERSPDVLAYADAFSGRDTPRSEADWLGGANACERSES